MNTTTAIRRPNISSPSPFLQALVALVAGFTLFLFFLLAWVLGFDLYHSGRIYPGISVAGVSVAGMEPDEAAALLSQRLTYPHSGKIVFQYGDQMWVAQPAELGLVLDPQASADQAYQLGRSGNPLARLGAQLGAWRSGRDLPPMMVFDQGAAQRYIGEIAAQVNRPVIEASLSVEGVDVVTLPGQVGREVDVEGALAAVEEQFRTLTDGLLTVAVRETPPEVMDAGPQAEAARQILGVPLTLHMPDDIEDQPGPWVIHPQKLAEMLVIERARSQDRVEYQLGLDGDAIRAYLEGLVPSVTRQPRNARFIFNDDTHLLEVIEPSVNGRYLDVEASAQRIAEMLLGGEHAVTLVVQYGEPDVGDQATGESLGITELVSAYTSYFRGSTASRMQNIEMAAANFHGLLVPPGATFSMASQMGDVTLDNGYAEAWIIFGGRTIKGVGGGVCQVSTTLFRTAFFAGFPIVERHPHAYRVSYYEQTRTGVDSDLAGLDATVFVPMVDFKFVNDTPYWLLMETYFNPTAHSLTWKFYSTKDGRTVSWETSGPQNEEEPPDPAYEESPDLTAGEFKQVDWAAIGADVSIVRTVYKDGQALFTDTFNTHYLPWRDVYQYGPGTTPKQIKQHQKAHAYRREDEIITI